MLTGRWKLKHQRLTSLYPMLACILHHTMNLDACYEFSCWCIFNLVRRFAACIGTWTAWGMLQRKRVPSRSRKFQPDGFRCRLYGIVKLSGLRLHGSGTVLR